MCGESITAAIYCLLSCPVDGHIADCLVHITDQLPRIYGTNLSKVLHSEWFIGHFRLPFRKLRLMADLCPTGPWFKESVGVRVLLKNNHNMSNALGFERLRGNPVCGRNSGLVWEILSCLRKGQLEYMMRGSNNLFKLESVLLNGLLVWHIQLYLYPILANEENRVEKLDWALKICCLWKQQLITAFAVVPWREMVMKSMFALGNRQNPG